MEKMGTSERKGGIIKKEERGKCVCVCVCLCACVGGGGVCSNSTCTLKHSLRELFSLPLRLKKDKGKQNTTKLQ